MNLTKIKELPADQRPRERLLHQGAAALKDEELLAILLRTGTRSHSALGLANEILKQQGGLQAFNEATTEELMEVPGVGLSKAVMLLASIEMGKRILEAKRGRDKAILSPKDCYEVLGAKMQHYEQEHFVVLFLDTKNNLIGKKTVSIGSLNKAVVHPREVFKEAIKRSAASIVCAHNHPSGDATPSAQDVQLTHRLEEVGELVGIKLVDHLVIGEGTYVSLREGGYLN